MMGVFVASIAMVMAVQNAFKDLGYWVTDKDVQVMMTNADRDGVIRYVTMADGKSWDISLTDQGDRGWRVSVRRLR